MVIKPVALYDWPEIRKTDAMIWCLISPFEVEVLKLSDDPESSIVQYDNLNIKSMMCDGLEFLDIQLESTIALN